MGLQHCRIAELRQKLTLVWMDSERTVLAQHAAPSDSSLAEFPESILCSEKQARDEHRGLILGRLAMMPSIKMLEQFDWAQAGEARTAQMLEPGPLAFVERAQSVVMLGPSGAGKTHIALALWQRAVLAGYKARFHHCCGSDDAPGNGPSSELLKPGPKRAVLGPKSLLVADIGYLPLAETGQHLFQRRGVTKRDLWCLRATYHLHNAPVHSQLTITAAILDGLLHHAHTVQISGESCRLRPGAPRRHRWPLHSLVLRGSTAMTPRSPWTAPGRDR